MIGADAQHRGVVDAVPPVSIEVMTDSASAPWIARYGTPLLLPLLEYLRANGWREDDEPRPTTLDHAIWSCTPTDGQGDANTHERVGLRPR